MFDVLFEVNVNRSNNNLLLFFIDGSINSGRLTVLLLKTFEISIISSAYFFEQRPFHKTLHRRKTLRNTDHSTPGVLPEASFIPGHFESAIL